MEQLHSGYVCGVKAVHNLLQSIVKEEEIFGQRWATPVEALLLIFYRNRETPLKLTCFIPGNCHSPAKGKF